MPRRFSVFCALALLGTLLVPATLPASADTRPKEDDRYVRNLDTPTPSFKSVTPNNVINGPNGTRIEIYGSVGDNEGAMDWRTIQAFSRLVSSVPKDKHSYTTLFNSLYDDRSVSLVGGKWTVPGPDEVFAPTAAFVHLANKYDTAAERKEFIHVLGAKESMDEAYAAKSSLARLVKAGAVDYKQCPGEGGCLSGPSHLMHSKYAAFEQAVDSQGTLRNNVIWITSSNLNGSSGSKKSNISIAIYNDEKAFTALSEGVFKPSVKVAGTDGLKYYQAIDSSPEYTAAIGIDPATGVMRGMPTDSGITLLPSPRKKYNAASDANIGSSDVEAAFLNAQAANPADKPGCKVYAVHSLFNSTRSGILDGLTKLYRQKCDVKIVLGDNAISDIVDGYFNMSEDLREVIGQVEFANVHDKTLSYKYGGTATAFGGASNFTGPGLEYDELAFQADNVGVTDSVQEHSERIHQLAKGQVTWTKPTSVYITPTTTVKVKPNESVKVATRVAPYNSLVTNTIFTSDNPSIASVDQTGKVTGHSAGTTIIRATVESPGNTTTPVYTKTAGKTVTVDPGAATTESAGGRAYIPPTLSMDNLQRPGDNTDIVVTWGSGGDKYSGIVKLQYYSSGWKTYSSYITVTNGVGKMSRTFSSSKTWRAYGAVLTKINGVAVPNSTTKIMSKWSINTVRTKGHSTTPRLYATTMQKSGSKIPFLISWSKSGSYRLQMRSPGGSWKTHSTHSMGSGEDFIIIPALNTKYWRVATSSGISNTVKVAMK
ncbi:Ig-like domain-containing protein [Aeromicrobium sp.]|uniref:Ig-like domain-containing protein n=1 Tax=Aeromicrobium sp. TaxID=1871063 RepID=UPI002FC80CF1